MKTIRQSLLMVLLLVFLPSANSEAGKVKVMAYNLCNYFVDGDHGRPLKSAQARDAVIGMISSASPDILLVSELGGGASLKVLQSGLKEKGLDYPFTKLIQGRDFQRHLAILSKTVPTRVIAKTDQSYKIKPKKGDAPAEDVRVSRGFLHATFTFPDGYKLNVIEAHLKSRMFHRRFNQTDMRRYEARLLRYYVDDLLKADPHANILVMGDMNDNFNKNPISTLRDDKAKPQVKLYDLRPRDQLGMSWTHWWNVYDTYGRIDYVFASYGILPEVDFDATVVHHIAEYWMFASDHRPLLVTLETGDRPAWSAETLKAKFPTGIYQFDTSGVENE